MKAPLPVYREIILAMENLCQSTSKNSSIHREMLPIHEKNSSIHGETMSIHEENSPIHGKPMPIHAQMNFIHE